MDEIKVSVCITFYNQVDNVDNAIASVMNQDTKFQIEVLIGDDGSIDGTWSKIKKWKDRFPDKIFAYKMSRDDGVNPTGFRASRNRLNLIKHVRGKYFTFLDGDDCYLDNTKLQKQVDILERKDNVDCVICAHDLLYIYPDGRQIPKYGDKLSEGKYSVDDYWIRLYFSTNTELIRSSVIKDVDFDLVEYNFNDNLITFLSIQKGSIYYIPKAMASYVQSGKGIWTGQKSIISNIRNIFICDLTSVINPRFNRLTDIRFRDSWAGLYKNRKNINRDELIDYWEEAKNKKLRYSLLWINYNKMNYFSKILLFWKLALVEFSYRLYRCHIK